MLLRIFLLLIFCYDVTIVLAAPPRSLGRNQIQGYSSVAPAFTELNYHGGPILTGPSSINVYLIFYGAFPRKDTSLISDFFGSFGPHQGQEPSVSTWWSAISSYKDKAGKPASSTLKLVKQIGVTYSMGKSIKRTNIANSIKNAIISREFPLDSHGIYLFLTSKDVAVERFCMGSCGFHESMTVASKPIVFAHVGDPLTQCPGLCSWPYAVPVYGPPGKPLVAPNDVGLDGMVMNIATILAGATTNPHKTGYFQGDALAPLEAVTACPGIFGTGAYPGYPGALLKNNITKASYNAHGAKDRVFLLPAMWDPRSMTCKAVI